MDTFLLVMRTSQFQSGQKGVSEALHAPEVGTLTALVSRETALINRPSTTT